MPFDAVSSVLEHTDDFNALESEVASTSEAVLTNNDGIDLHKDSLAKIIALQWNLKTKKHDIVKRHAEYSKPGAKIKSATRTKKNLELQKTNVNNDISSITTTEITPRDTEITRIQTWEIDRIKWEIAHIETVDIKDLNDDIKDIDMNIITENSNIDKYDQKIEKHTIKMQALGTKIDRNTYIKTVINPLEKKRKRLTTKIASYNRDKKDKEREIKELRRQVAEKEREMKDRRNEQNTLRKEIDWFKRDQTQKQQKLVDLDNQIFSQDDKVIELKQQEKEAKWEYTNLWKRAAAIKRIDQEKQHYGKIIQLWSQMHLDNIAIEKTPEKMKKTWVLRRGSLEMNASGDFFKGSAPDNTSFAVSGEKWAKVSIDEKTWAITIFGLKKHKLPPEITFKVKATVPVPPEVNGKVPKATHSKTYTIKTSTLQAAYANESWESESKALGLAKKTWKWMLWLTRGIWRTLTGLLWVSLVGKPSLISMWIVNGWSTGLEYAVKKPIDKMMELHKSEQWWMYAPKMAVKVPYYAAKNIALAPFKAVRSRWKGYTSYWKDSALLMPELVAGNIGAKEAVVKNLRALKNNHKVADFTPKVVDDFLKAA